MAPTTAKSSDLIFEWEGRNRRGQIMRGEVSANGVAQVEAQLRRQGITPSKISKRRPIKGKAIKPRDIAIFTRQLATMMKAGVPLIQSFEIVGNGHPNPRVGKLLTDIKNDVETGSTLSTAFRKYPLYFNDLYCNLIEAGEAAGILESLLNNLATYMEKIENIKSKIKSALMYPIAVVSVAFAVISVIMIWVVPSFKTVFSSFGAELPAPTLLVIGISEFFVSYWYLIFGGLGGGLFLFLRALRTNKELQGKVDRALLKMPIFGALVEKSVVARWTRTLSTMFGAGVPLVEALNSVGGAAGNSVYATATTKIRQEVSSGVGLTAAMTNARLFPVMVLQMCAIGEESGAIDTMLGKAADFYEAEVDTMVAGLSSLMEPIIIVVLGSIVGGIVVSMYLPIFKLGSIV